MTSFQEHWAIHALCISSKLAEAATQRQPRVVLVSWKSETLLHRTSDLGACGGLADFSLLLGWNCAGREALGVAIGQRRLERQMSLRRNDETPLERLFFRITRGTVEATQWNTTVDDLVDANASLPAA